MSLLLAAEEKRERREEGLEMGQDQGGGGVDQ